MNSIMERWIGGCRRELLDRTLIWTCPTSAGSWRPVSGTTTTTGLIWPYQAPLRSSRFPQGNRPRGLSESGDATGREASSTSTSTSLTVTSVNDIFGKDRILLPFLVSFWAWTGMVMGQGGPGRASREGLALMPGAASGREPHEEEMRLTPARCLLRPFSSHWRFRRTEGCPYREA
jgi:hypothetical protein